MTVSVTLSSVGTSNPLIMDFYGHGAATTTIRVTLGSTSMTTNTFVQATIDSSVGSDGSSGAWYAISTTAITSANADAGVTYNLTTPVAGLRLSSSAISASTITLKALQTGG